MRRLGHQQTPWNPQGWLFNSVWGLPIRLYSRVVYESRPDVVTVKANRDHWRRLHSQWRFADSLLCCIGPPGHILWNIRVPFFAVMCTTILVAVLEYLEIQHSPANTDTLIRSFQLTSFVVALLLTLRLNRAYDRWLRAQAGFSGTGRAMLALTQQAAAFLNDPNLQAELERWGIVLIYGTLGFVLSLPRLHPAAAEVLSEEELQVVEGSPKAVYAVMARLRVLVGGAVLPAEKLLAMNDSIARGMDACCSCMGVLEQATPQVLSLLSTGFVFTWLLFLPFGLWEATARTVMWLTVPAMALMAALLLGCDEAASQLEDPFNLLPLEDMARRSVGDMRRSKLEALELAALAAKGLNGNLAGKQGEAQQQQQQGGSESSKAGSRAGDDTCIPVT